MWKKSTLRWGGSLCAAMLLLSGASTGFAAQQDSRTTAVLKILEAAIADPHYDVAFEAYIRTLPKDGEDHYFVEGDLRMTEREVRVYLENMGRADRGGTNAVELKVARDPATNNLSYWKDPQDRKITYTIDKVSFRTQAEAEKTLEFMKKATVDWESACRECEISFTYVDRKGAGSKFEKVLFVVRYRNQSSGPIARAFFPYSSPRERKLEVFPSFFSPTMMLDRIGVLRHELGHILGYRHEHIDGIPGCRTEGGSWSPLTPYDSESVMHYFCGGGGTLKLAISEIDKEGHHCLYVRNGPPC